MKRKNIPFIFEVTIEDVVAPLPWRARPEPEFQTPEAGRYSLNLEEFLKEGEKHIGGEEMLKRADNIGANGTYAHAKALKRQQHLIPEELRGRGWFFFPKAIVRDRDSGGLRRVAWFLWFVGRWHLRWGWLDNSFGQSCRLVRVHKVS